MLDEYHKNCKSDLKGKPVVELQPCDIDPSGTNCPPYINGTSHVNLYIDENEQELMQTYSCFNGKGGSSSDWITMYGAITYGTVGTYVVDLTCLKEDSNADLDAVPLTVTVDVIDRR
jgi:hypothetical protein